MPFEFFDRKEEYSIRQGNLPHWYQPGVTYFVTFRTADSVPQQLVRDWHVRRSVWLRQHGIDPTTNSWRGLLEANPDLEAEFNTKFTREFMSYLDQGYGECWRRKPELATIVGESLRHFDGSRYELGDFVVMPNHVHLLVCLIGETEIESQCAEWKRFTGRAVNRLVGRKGRFWQEESLDHLVRSAEQFEYLRRYIAENPIKAGLRPGEYLYRRRADA